jgi:putative spermidine/putrescine transport system permease protein
MQTLSFGAAIAVLSTIAVVFLLAPTLVLLVVSFTDAESLRFPPTGYSVRWYASLLEADQLLDAARNSLVVAVITTVLCVGLGIPAALWIGRSRAAWAKVADAIFMSPLLLPALAFGFGALIFFSQVGLAQSTAGLVIGHAVVCVPFILRNTIAALAQLEQTLLEASESLGASAAYTFRRVTLPLIARGVAAGAFIAFMSSFDNVPVSLFLADARTQMLPIHMWEIIETNLDVRTAAASGVIVLATLLLMVLAERFAGLSRSLRR